MSLTFHDATALSFVLRNDGEACQEFLILPTDRKEGRRKEGERKKRRKLKIAETDSEARKQKQDGKGGGYNSLSLSFYRSFPVTGTIFVILPRGNRNGVREKDRTMACF